MKQRLPAIAGIQAPESKARLLLSSLGIVALVIGLYFMLIDIAYWLPEKYGDTFLDLAGPLEGLPAEGIWTVQAILLRILACGLCLLLIYGFFKLFHNRRLRLPFRRITAEQKSVMYKHIVFYFLVLAGINLLFSFTALGELVAEGSEPESIEVGWLGQLVFFSFIVIVGPLFEEILFRGFLHKRLRLAFSFWPAFLVSGLVFSALHFVPGEPLSYNLYGIGSTLVFSYFVTKTFEATDNIWTAFIFHGLYNGWVMLWMFVENAFTSFA